MVADATTNQATYYDHAGDLEAVGVEMIDGQPGPRGMALDRKSVVWFDLNKVKWHLLRNTRW
jgi:hypothetical protein